MSLELPNGLLQCTIGFSELLGDFGRPAGRTGPDGAQQQTGGKQGLQRLVAQLVPEVSLLTYLGQHPGLQLIGFPRIQPAFQKTQHHKRQHGSDGTVDEYFDKKVVLGP